MRSLLLVPFTLTLGVGCGFLTTPKFQLAPQLSCTAPMLFDADLTTHLTEGPGDGNFDYDPEGRFKARITGQYDLGTGDFLYEAEYDEDAWVVKTEVVGFGFAKENGDLDIRYTSTRTDVNDVERVVEARLERVGCEQTLRFVDDDLGVETVEQGEFTADGYAYVRTTPVDGEDDQIVVGLTAPDLTFTETFDWQSDAYDYEYERTGDADGYSKTEWEQHDDQWDYEGTTEVFLDGSTRESYTGDDGDTTFYQEYELDYDGNGEGTYETGNTTCDLFYDEFACTYDCGRGNTGDC